MAFRVVVSLLGCCLLLTACESARQPAERSVEAQEARKLSGDDARTLILSALSEDERKGWMKEIEKEIPFDMTTDDIWEQTHCQLFKLRVGFGLETFLVNNRKAAKIGSGFGGFGVTSAVPFDVDQDGNTDIVYAYSYGSGLDVSAVAWIDLIGFTQHLAEEMPPYDAPTSIYDSSLAGYDLQNDGDEVGVYVPESRLDQDGRKEIRKVGILVRESGKLRFLSESNAGKQNVQ